MNANSDLICNICKTYLKNPITLPCKCVICEEHLHDGTAKNGYIKCKKCQRDFFIPENGFPLNEMIKNILEKELYLNDEEKAIKKSIQESIHQLDEIQNQLKLKYSDLEIISHDHFEDIRRKIVLERDTIKAKIDKIASRILEEANEKENIYKSKLENIMSKTKDVEIQKSNKIYIDEFRKPKLIIENVKNVLDENKTKIKEFQRKLNDFDIIKNEIKDLELKMDQEFLNETFGIVKLKNSLIQTKIISCSDDKSIKVWDLETKECINIFKEHSDRVTCLEAIGHNIFASGSTDKTIKVWDVKENVCLKTLKGHEHGIICLKYLSLNKIVSGSFKVFKLWNIDSGVCIETFDAHTSWIYDLIILPDGNLVSCSDDATIKVWDLDEKNSVKTLKLDSPVYCLLLLNNGLLCSGTKDKGIKIWNIESGKCIKTLTGHSSFIEELNQLENGRLVSCSDDKTIKIWDVELESCIKTLTGHNGLIRTIRIKQNGLLMSCSSDGAIKTWDIETGACVNSIEGHDGKPINDLVLF